MQSALGYLPPSPIFPQHFLVQTRQEAFECYSKNVKAEASGELSAQSQADKYRVLHLNTETHTLKLYKLVLSRFIYTCIN